MLLDQVVAIIPVWKQFVVALAILCAGIMVVFRWRYGQRIALLTAQRDDYIGKLGGASPDEAEALIKNLEQQLASLSEKVEPRRLAEEQRRLIIENATLPAGKAYRISIQHEVEGDSPEYAGDYVNAFQQTPGWDVRRYGFFQATEVGTPDHGVLIVANPHTPNSLTSPAMLAIRRALDAARVTYEFAPHPAGSGSADVFLLIRSR